MIARRGMLGLIAGGAAMLSGCGLFGGESYRFRMTVEVDTPEGVRTGSSVYQVRAWNTVKLLPDERARDWTVEGEAVAVNLPGGRTLFALLKTMQADLVVTSMVALDPAFRNDVVESARRIGDGTAIRLSAAVPPSSYPLLVMFTDAADPKSVREVDPADLAATLGASVKLKRLTIQVTDDRLTASLLKRLPWLTQLDGPMLDGSSINNSNNLASLLGAGDFTK